MKGLYHKRGATFRLRIRAEDGDGAGIDLTGCSAAMAWTIGGTEAVRVSTDEGGLVIVPTPEPEEPVDPEIEPEPHPDTGVMLATISAETTAALALGNYRSDLKVIWSDGSVSYGETLIVSLIEAQTI